MKLSQSQADIRLVVNPAGYVGIQFTALTAERIVLAPTRAQLTLLTTAIGSVLGRALLGFDFEGAWNAIRLNPECVNVVMDAEGRVSVVVPKDAEGNGRMAAPGASPSATVGPGEPTIQAG